MDLNYAEEQANELEALQSIYPEELEVVGPGQFQITVKSQDYDLAPEGGCRCLLAISCPERYPDEVPQVEMLEEPENCTPLEIEQLMEMMQAEAEANIGMVMIFTIVNAAGEWLNCHCDELRRRKEEEAERIKREVEEAERKRFEGTRVTVETFLVWKESFEREMNSLRAEKARQLEAARRSKLSGRELFQKDNTLDSSDIKFLEDGTVLADLLFEFHKIESPFGVLAERKCLPADYNASSLTAETAAYQCAAKANSSDVPCVCLGAPVLSLFYNCLAHSLGDLVIVDGVKTFDMTIMENKLMSFTNDASWNLAQDELIKRCKQRALTSLTPQQRAVYTYMCNSFSLYAYCDRLQADRGALDESGMARRELFLQHGVYLMVNAIGQNASVAWTECRQNAGYIEDVTQRYANTLSAAACLLRKFFDNAGLLDTGRLFEQAAVTLASGGLEELVDRCGPSVEGYLTAEEFLQCCVKAGPFIMAVSSSNFVASGMPESCTILL